MVNHFRSLLLNTTPYDVATAHANHIAKDYITYPLTSPLSAIYAILFPTSDVTIKLKLLYIYERCIQAAGLTSAITSLDSRVTYDIAELGDIFKPATVSKVYQMDGTTSNLEFVTQGFYTPANQTDNEWHYYNFEQGANSGTAKKMDIVMGDTSVLTAPLTIDVTNDTACESSWFNIPDTGVQFKIVQTTDFLITNYGKKWRLVIMPPLEFIVKDIVTKLNGVHTSISDLSRLKSNIDAAPYDKLYKTHFNDIYKLAGLLVSFVYHLDYIRSK